MIRQAVNSLRVLAARAILPAPVREFAPLSGHQIKMLHTDVQRFYFADNLTPERAETILKSADRGQIMEAVQLFQEIEERNPLLRPLLEKRRLALTSLEWELVAAHEVKNDKRIDPVLSEEAKEYTQEVLDGIEGLDQGLSHLAFGVTNGVAVAEIEWGPRNRPVSLQCVPATRLRQKTSGGDYRLHVTLNPSDTEGTPAVRDKWIVHAPSAIDGLVQRGSLMRSLIMLHLGASYAIRDWQRYLEVFGMPMRVAQYQDGASSEEKLELLRMLKLLGSDAVAVFSQGANLELKESSQRGTAPFEAFLRWMDDKNSIAVLGNTLTTSMNESGGSFAAATVHSDVKEEIASKDRRDEASTLRPQLVEPIVRIGFRPDAPVPYWRRRVVEHKDKAADAVWVATLAGAGARIPHSWVHEHFEVPEPQVVDVTDPRTNEVIDRKLEPVLEATQPVMPGGFGGFGGSGNG